MKKLLFLFLSMLITNCFAQQKRYDYAQVKPGEWFVQKTDTVDFAMEQYEGKPALLLKRKIGNSKSVSLAFPKGLNFKDGIIELDIASPGGKNGYVGMAFHIKDSHHYETLYFRPGSSGTSNAVQYMPEKKLEFNWWDYEADKYQAKATLPEKAWFHVKAVVKGRTLKVFLNNSKIPVMVRNDLEASLKEGSAGFWLGNSSTGAYTNLKVEAFD